MKSLKKVLALGSALAGLIALAAPAAMAQTIVTGTWSGAGTGTMNAVATGSTTSNFSIAGNSINGNASFSNAQNNPYGYGVDSTSFNVNGQVASGGQIMAQTDRTGSYTPLYGAAGQSIVAGAFSSDGNAALVQHTNVNYAGMNDIGYGNLATPGGKTLEASGTVIQLNYSLNTGAVNNNAGFLLNGTGNAAVKLSSSGVDAGGFGLGQGQGIYTQADFSGQGIGSFSTGAVATGGISVANNGSQIFGTAANPASVTTTVNYATTGVQIQSWNFAIGGTKN